MNLNEIEAKCFIMALFIRDDGLRFLLGSGAYEFKDSQLMFAGNTIENDVVSVQGNDGYMLAGQVRRPTTQVFDGYIGDASVSKSEVEGYRRDFMAFFQKNHFYTVVYVMADGSAIQRRRGFLVDAPTSQELWQMYPEYHVALNFEDVNYYKYSENDDGEETYAKSADIGLAKVQYGGLIWDDNSEIEISGTGTNITLAGTMEGGAIESVELNGDTTQTTYSGKNLLNITKGTFTQNGITFTQNPDGSVTMNGTSTGNAYYEMNNTAASQTTITSGVRYTLSIGNVTLPSGKVIVQLRKVNPNTIYCAVSDKSVSFTAPETTTTFTYIGVYGSGVTLNNVTIYPMLEVGSSMTSFEPYVGGTASPNPDYPQAVQTVTGRQVVTITDGGSESQEYEINLGKNLLDEATMESGSFNYLNGGLFANATFIRSQQVHCEPNTTYAFSSNSVLGEFAVVYYASDKTTVVPGEGYLANYRSTTFTTPATARYMRVKVGGSANPRTLDGDWDLQIEKGSTATTYAPYFTPIELCKIGTYQDYIYKSGEDWYVHKEIKKFDLSTINYDGAGGGNFYNIGFGTAQGYNPSIPQLSNCFTYDSTTWAGKGKFGIAVGTGNLWMTITDSTVEPGDAANWLKSRGAIMYGALRNAVTYKITYEPLVTQLEDLLSATTYSGNTYITVSGDLASPLEIKVTSIGGGGVVWDENGAEWEAGGGGEIVIVNVDSIENILPVWTIRGEAENPTLTNLTTGMSITYNGTVASGQTLVIDLLNKTAKLNGTSVISDVSGQWVEFKPGNNRVSYSTENANAPDSTIEWQEVVG